MYKNIKENLKIIFLSVLLIFLVGCNIIQKSDDGDTGITEVKKVPQGLVMQFVENNPQSNYIVSDEEEPITILVDVSNKGTYPEEGTEDQITFGGGKIYISGFDRRIIDIPEQSKSLANMFLPGASLLNPEGSVDTAIFEGNIVTTGIKIDRYDTVILVTACYPYATKTTPSVCIDPDPFDNKQEKVCNIGSQTLSGQGAPVTITKVEQEASSNKIRFKINMKNVGGGDILKPGTLNKCDPSGSLDRKDFDRVELKSLTVGSVDLFANGKCTPFSDGTNNIIRLFDGEGFIICTLDVGELGDVTSAYTTPLSIDISYVYRSTISTPIKISKLTDD